MSGSLRFDPSLPEAAVHDHFDLVTDQGVLRLNDPRRFGAVLWLDSPAEDHALLRGLGLEPLDASFSGAALRERAKGRRVAIKQFLMNGGILTGVGNIYASESLFRAGIHPARSAGRISAERWDRLADSIRHTLASAIDAGGSTLRDFVSAEGRPGYFQHRHAVYDRAGKACPRCRAKIRAIRQGQRSTFFCPGCQT
jgi:formamidopyrimidine-DNA glycosylase